MGGLLPPLGDVLLGQQLAQPGVLVVHGPFPFLQLPAACSSGHGRPWSSLASSE
jgi:hypothetical protein